MNEENALSTEFKEAVEAAQKNNTTHELNWAVFCMQCEIRNVVRIIQKLKNQ